MSDTQTGNDKGLTKHYVDVVVALVLLVLSFIGVAWSDVSSVQNHWYWSGLAIVFGVACFALQWMHADAETPILKQGLRTALHWLGVLAAIQIIYIYVGAGRFTNEVTGLVNGLVLAIGVYLAGVYLGWWLFVIGIALGIALAVTAIVEQYFLVLSVVAIIAAGIMVLGTRWRNRRQMDAEMA